MKNILNKRWVKLAFLLTVIFALQLGVKEQAAGQETSATSLSREAEIKEARKLNHEVEELINRGKFDEATPKAMRALEMTQRIFGQEHPDVAIALVNYGYLFYVKNDYTKARELYQRALAMHKKLGLENAETASALNNLALLSYMEHDLAKAEELFRAALAIDEKIPHGLETPAAATILSNIGTILSEKGDYQGQEQLFRRVLATQEKELGLENRALIRTLHDLALVRQQRGDPGEAIQLLNRALAIADKSPEHQGQDALPILSNLLMLYVQGGNYEKAESIGQRSLTSVEGRAEENSADVAIAYNSLGQWYKAKGDYKNAESFYLRALDTFEKALLMGQPYASELLTQLGLLYVEEGKYAKAEELLQRAKTMRENALGPNHPNFATSLVNLAELYRIKGEAAKAESMFEQALAAYKNLVGEQHPGSATIINNLGVLSYTRGDLRRAETLLQQGLNIREQMLPSKHPDIAVSLRNLDLLYNAKGDFDGALKAANRAAEIEEYNLNLTLGTGSENQNRNRWLTLYKTMMMDVSLHVRDAPNNKAAARLALTTVLRRKGRVLDSMTDSMQALRDSSNPADKDLLKKLSAVRSQLAALMSENLDSAVDKNKLATREKLEAEYQRLEEIANARNAESRIQSRPVTIESIQQLIPKGAALIEFVSYMPFNARAVKTGERPGRRYVAYVLHHDGEVGWAELGEALPIEDDITNLRSALRNPDAKPEGKDIKSLAGKLDKKIMRPLRKLIGQSRWLFISPDVSLQLLPFEALVDERGHYLIEKYLFTYLSSARELRRLQFHAPSRQPPVIIANPDFDLGRRQEKLSSSNRVAASPQSTTPLGITFAPLTGTEEEARQIKKLLPQAQVLIGSEATAEALKQVHGPSVLHIGTHGFFPKTVPWGSTNPDITKINNVEVFKPNIVNLVLEIFPTTREAGDYIDSMSQSGIALAGANNHAKTDGEDGILTAFEVSGLDLRGTKLVVLSACETALGNVEGGNGVYGLRRALVIAGAESQVMSLWKVNDEITKDIMITFYTRLLNGEGRSEAIRQAKLGMLRSKNYSHPYYWASFIQAGDWRSIDARLN